ncbi:lysine--tRNA ligase [bacterium]|nr:lysine--tRNA ligase [bacterium]
MEEIFLKKIKEERKKKIESLRKKNINPFPEFSKEFFLIKEVFENFSKLKKRKKKILVCGRIFAKREMGKLCFLDLKQNHYKIQILLKKDVLKDDFSFLLKFLELGDIIAVKGTLFETKTKEKTILAEKIQILAKASLPLPKEWYGLKDVEERFRKRYLDLLLNKEVYEKFILKSKIISFIRNYFLKNNFLEVETPILQPIPGGASAMPFETFHQSLKLNLYLRIAPELYLKRLIIGGYQKIFEIGKCFRNEGIDNTHNPEFLMIEAYWSYANYLNFMNFLEKLLKNLLKEIFKTKKIKYQNFNLDFSKKFEIIDIVKKVKDDSGIDFENDSDKEIVKKIKKLKIEINKKLPPKYLFDFVFKKISLPKIIQPTFVVLHPKNISPLAKRNSKNHLRASRFQLIIAGMEVANGYSEENDPKEQKKAFLEQQKLLKIDKEVQRYDSDFLEALNYGMPPTTGLGIGLERLTMILTNTSNIKEIIFFPLLKPK